VAEKLPLFLWFSGENEVLFVPVGRISGKHLARDLSTIELQKVRF